MIKQCNTALCQLMKRPAGDLPAFSIQTGCSLASCPQGWVGCATIPAIVSQQAGLHSCISRAPGWDRPPSAAILAISRLTLNVAALAWFRKLKEGQVGLSSTSELEQGG
ncbi:hypothetical protein JRQ81_011923 [Phrynocephalus forsythii]|uniref:Uncharacterized protein n=1 Tax=Phrynocephalus forsythii TaxID=171643 RepID=A0A9Q0X6R3_9SAUR|nr:hypothetical protein JRQ81_011923 [Phrynocephalus forsythii]